MADKDKKLNKSDNAEKQVKTTKTQQNPKTKEKIKDSDKESNKKSSNKSNNKNSKNKVENNKAKDIVLKKESFITKLNFETKIIILTIVTLLLTYIFYFSGRIGVLSLFKGVFLGTFGFVVISIPVVAGLYTYLAYQNKNFEINIVKIVYFSLACVSLSMLLSTVFFNGDITAVDAFYKGYETGSYLTFGFIATVVANLVTKLAGQGIAIILFMMLTMFLVFFGFEKDFKEVMEIIRNWFNQMFNVEEDEDYKEFYNTKKHKLADIEKRYNEEQEEKLRQEEIQREQELEKQKELERKEQQREEQLSLEKIKEEKLREEQLAEAKLKEERLVQEKLELERQQQAEQEKLREYKFSKNNTQNSNQSSNVDEEDDVMKNENQDGEVLNQEYIRYMREKKARKEQALKEALDGKFAKENTKNKYAQKNQKLKGRDLRLMPKPKFFKVEPREEGYENSEDNANKIVFNRDIFDAREQGIKLYELVAEEKQSREFEVAYDESKKINERLFNDSVDHMDQNDNSFIDNYINAESAIRWVNGQNVENNDYAHNVTENSNINNNNDLNQPQTNINVNINIDTNEEQRRKQEKYLARTAVLDEVYNKVKHEIIEYFNDNTRDNFDYTKKPRVNSNINTNQSPENNQVDNTANNSENNGLDSTNQDTQNQQNQQVVFTPNFIMHDPVTTEDRTKDVEEETKEETKEELPIVVENQNQIQTSNTQLTMASTDELRTYATNTMDNYRSGLNNSNNSNNSSDYNYSNSPSSEFANNNNSNFEDVSKEITEELKEEIKGEVKEKILKEFAERIFENMSQEDKEEFLLGMRNAEKDSNTTGNTYRNYENAKAQSAIAKPADNNNLNSSISLGQPLNVQKSIDENDVKVYNINSGVDNYNNFNANQQSINKNTSQNHTPNLNINPTMDVDMKVYGGTTPKPIFEQTQKFHDELGYEYNKQVDDYKNGDYNSNSNDYNSSKEYENKVGFEEEYEDDLYDDLSLDDMYNEDEFDLDEIEKEYAEYANNVGHTNIANNSSTNSSTNSNINSNSSFNNTNANANNTMNNNISQNKPQSTLKHIDTVATRNKPYEYPSIDILAKNTTPSTKMSDEEIKANSELLEQTLSSFGVKVKVLNVTQGPTVTRYELQPGIGVKVSKIVGLADDLALNLAAQGIRIEAPIPGKSAVGIEVPNAERENIFFRDILENDEFLNHKSKIAITLGKDISGQPVVADIGSMPHLLVAGATGSGKSVCINTLITSILYRATPEECKLLMIDPKVVELSIYNGIPHLMIPVVTDPKKACAALQWAVSEMEKRYEYFAEVSVRNLDGYNQYVKDNNMGETLPKVVIIVDELADLMMTAGKEVEESICRLTQKARAAGIHLIVATQRPSVDVITGLIKANIPSRIAFSVSSGIDSRTILGEVGAEKLLGRGDMLFIPYGSNEQIRIQGAFISDKEVENIVTHLKETSVVTYDESIIEEITSGSGGSNKGISQEDADDLLNEAMELFIERDKASISMLQTRFKVGYNRAARIIDNLESAGYIGEQDGSKGRKILISRSEWENING